MIGTRVFLPFWIAMSTMQAVAQGVGDEHVLRRADAELVSALNARDVDRWLAYFADDAAMWPHCEERVIGKDAVAREIEPPKTHYSTSTSSKRCSCSLAITSSLTAKLS